MENKSAGHSVQTKEIITDEFMDWEERDSSTMSFAKHCVAGSCAGIMEHLGLYPVDTIKVSKILTDNHLQ